MKSNSTLLQRHSGFTLVELLVVVTIIAVLASLGFVGARKVMDSAAKTKAVNNLKQLATTGQLFSSDNNGIIPHAQHTAIDRVKRIWCQHYVVSLSPDLAVNNQFSETAGDQYGRAAGMFADEKALKKGSKTLAKSGPNSWRTFAYNNRIGAASPENPGDLAWVRGVRHLSQVEVPNKLVMYAHKTLVGDNYPQFLQPEDAKSGTVDFDLHGGMAVVGFYDGHVELYQKQNFPADGGKSRSTGKAYSATELNEFWLGRATPLPQL